MLPLLLFESLNGAQDLDERHDALEQASLVHGTEFLQVLGVQNQPINLLAFGVDLGDHLRQSAGKLEDIFLLNPDARRAPQGLYGFQMEVELEELLPFPAGGRVPNRQGGLEEKSTLKD